ncbi:hypothetical protein [Streptomyces sp. NPDC037389]|uniref:hypothetical protein n=1 Tax=Streptomyces sp. NPDC037389 TaxID=3155369 RepID=UPI0033E5DAF8
MFQLRCFLTLLDDADHRLREQARTAVLRWGPADARSAYAALPADERARLDALVERAVPVLGEDKVRLLRFFLGRGVTPDGPGRRPPRAARWRFRLR